MAHNLHTNSNGKTSFAAVGQVAWHGLGQYVKEAMTSKECIELAGLDYTVVKSPIYIPGNDQPIPGHFATVRTDTNVPLGVVKSFYEVIQNREAFEFFDSIVDSGEAIYQTAGALGKGERIFITAKLPNDIQIKGEEVNGYLLLTSSHDGSGAIQCGFTSIRVVCNNTLTAALRGLSNKVSVMHFSNAKENLKSAAKVMGLASKYSTELNQIFNKMATVKINDKQLRQYIENVMRGSNETMTTDEYNSLSKQFTKKIDLIEDFAHAHETQRTDAAKGTIWGAYNAVSGYYSFLKDYKSQEDKMKDVYFNDGSKKIETAFDYAVQLMN